MTLANIARAITHLTPTSRHRRPAATAATSAGPPTLPAAAALPSVPPRSAFTIAVPIAIPASVLLPVTVAATVPLAIAGGWGRRQWRRTWTRALVVVHLHFHTGRLAVIRRQDRRALWRRGAVAAGLRRALPLRLLRLDARERRG